MQRLARCGLTQILADFGQITWRKSLLTLSKNCTKVQTALPHNMASPFFRLFALVWPPSVYRHDRWQTEAHGSRTGFNAEEHRSAR